ncbi:MAG: glutamyl-tRNA reductase [Peptostreptococcaceae bacterium]
MNFGVIGINHNYAPIEIREKVAFIDTKKIEATNILLDKEIEELVILSTCNRSEIYFGSNNIDRIKYDLNNFYEDFFDLKNISQYIFYKENNDAIDHLFKVTSGLDSTIIGEDQILGQVIDAYEFSINLGSTKKLFNKIFREAINTAKEIKNKTKISEKPLSISYIGVKYIKEKLNNLKDKNALIVGIGKMNKLTIKYLQDEGINKIYLSNRNHKKVFDVEKEYKNVIPIKYEDRYSIFDDIDILISATASPHIIVSYDKIDKNLKNNIMMLDIALPRDIDPKVNVLDNIELYDIDDLKYIQNENLEERIELAKIGMDIIENNIYELYDWINSSKIDPTIKSLNNRCEDIRIDTLNYIFNKIDLDNKEKKIIDKMLNSALKRVIREPIINLKKVKDENKQEELVKLIEELFEI